MFRSNTIIQAKTIGDNNKIVVNLDIGDTYSGFSSATKEVFMGDQWTVRMNDGWPREKDVTYKTSTTVLLQVNRKVIAGCNLYCKLQHTFCKSH